MLGAMSDTDTPALDVPALAEVTASFTAPAWSGSCLNQIRNPNGKILKRDLKQELLEA